MIHVEMYDSGMFCGVDSGWPETIPSEHHVAQEHWHYEPEQIQRATCPDCLLKIFMLGDSAGIAMKRLGMKIEVRNVGEES